MSEENETLPIESIFTADDDWHCNACLNWSHDSLELFVMGYKEAADSLVARVIETGRHQDTLVFPICFLYRQYIELRLKEIIQSGKRILDEPGKFPQHHNIQKLWETATPIMNRVFPEDQEPPNIVTLASHVVAEFSNIDPASFAFRYPSDKQGTNPLEGLAHINVRKVAEYVNAFAEVIDAVSSAISVYLDQKNEFQSYEY
jgi:hypothetical protein